VLQRGLTEECVVLKHPLTPRRCYGLSRRELNQGHGRRIASFVACAWTYTSSAAVAGPSCCTRRLTQRNILPVPTLLRLPPPATLPRLGSDKVYAVDVCVLFSRWVCQQSGTVPASEPLRLRSSSPSMTSCCMTRNTRGCCHLICVPLGHLTEPGIWLPSVALLFSRVDPLCSPPARPRWPMRASNNKVRLTAFGGSNGKQPQEPGRPEHISHSTGRIVNIARRQQAETTAGRLDSIPSSVDRKDKRGFLGVWQHSRPPGYQCDISRPD
jgi:hypothetical protein